MGWFGKDEIEATGKATQSITSGLRQLFTGDIPPEIVSEMNRMDDEHISERWKADNNIPWYLSSRAIVMLWLNFHPVKFAWSFQNAKPPSDRSGM